MTITEKIKQAITALKAGQLIIVADDANREAEGDLVGFGSFASPENVNFMTQHARGLLCAPIGREIAKKLDLLPMVTHNTERYGTAFTVSVDHKTTSTGISAFDRAKTIQALAAADSQATDFERPGHIFPLIAEDDGVLKRRGHTEAAIDLTRIAKVTPVAYICEIMKADGHMARYQNLQQLAKDWDLPLITIEEITAYRQLLQTNTQASPVTEQVEVKLPTAQGDFKLRLYTEADGTEDLVLIKGEPWQVKAPFVRVHSECLTGEVFESHRCDCGEQLDKAMAMIEEQGAGAIIYLRQEGRGIGLLNKLKAYALQEQGLDTYEANERLGFAPDARDYSVAAEILDQLGLSKIQLLTNNPDKIKALEAHGIEVVKRIPLETTVYAENYGYLTTKKNKFHHQLVL
ncbi:GTP cyclohydrolase II [Agrilactobacillus yilanensis]|uniref:Multifunctional fusion protein n=1 Tax=Agrilactobacillus yilanensis TaxID=2485997 RepID=A0ABW4J4V7_9LACO|nr:GTP cyclohydrolase II [Agrilactobacillus yilanensis]